MHIETRKVEITGGFWQKRQKLNKEVTLKAVQDRFAETNRFSAWDFSDPEKPIPHIFYDSDVAKWIEGAAFILQKERNEELEAFVDNLVDLIEKNRSEDGYFNSHFLRKPEARWTNRWNHELYNAGHLMEAAVEYYKATGKDKFLRLVEDFADYIYQVFVVEDDRPFKTPGHEEIELALVKLYDLTKKEKYLQLSKHFVDTRGTIEEPWITENYNRYNVQDHLPVREQTTGEGHAVRASYLYSSMADLALKYNDKDLLKAAKAIFSNIVNKRMYITGGTGTSPLGEAYTLDYDLPNSRGYGETCAAIALAFFAQRMLLLEKDSVYADTVERIMYNGMLSGISLDGKSFFYENPLEIQPELNKRNVSTTFREHSALTQRKEVFSCSCCPPNVLRFIANLNNYIYTLEEDTLYINQFITSKMEDDKIKASIKTDYPLDSKVLVKASNVKRLAIRKPYWASQVNVKLNSKSCEYKLTKGYLYIDLDQKESTVEVEFPMELRYVRSNPKVHENSHKTAIMIGPMVYCAERVDNDFSLNNIRFNYDGKFSKTWSDELDTNIIELKVEIPKERPELYSCKPFEYEEKTLKLIPYYTFANRGESEMRVWL